MISFSNSVSRTLSFSPNCRAVQEYFTLCPCVEPAFKNCSMWQTVQIIVKIPNCIRGREESLLCYCKHKGKQEWKAFESQFWPFPAIICSWKYRPSEREPSTVTWMDTQFTLLMMQHLLQRWDWRVWLKNLTAVTRLSMSFPHELNEDMTGKLKNY